MDFSPPFVVLEFSRYFLPKRPDERHRGH